MPNHNRTFRTLTLFLIFTFLLSSCSVLDIFTFSQTAVENYPQAEVIFKVTLPKELSENTTLALEIVDDVTGLSFNPQRYEMTRQDELNYFVKLPLVIGSVLKYRYVRVSDMNTVEYTPQGTQVRFRLAEITGPLIFQDNIAGWIDQPYKGVIGRSRGQFIDPVTNSPIPNLLVTAEGVQTVTTADGTFILEGLTPGTHNLVVYSMDGLYETFQQGVLIADEATTPVYVYVTKRDTVKVTFEVNTPPDFDSSIPLRFASNLQSQGNLYTDLYSGSITTASNLPVLTKVREGKYSLTLDLPVGFDLRYKFTLGDGLWNSELNPSGSFRLRELIVKEGQTRVVNEVATFNSPNLQPITFVVTTSQDTPTDDKVSIQFNPFGWFESIPMVKAGEHEWHYTLYSPLHILGEVEYRFCRNDLCEFTSAVATTNQVFLPSASPQTFTVAIDQWSNYGIAYQYNLITDGGGMAPRPAFLAGFELTADHQPITINSLDTAYSRMVSDAANVVVIPCTFTATRNNPPFLEPVPGTDYSWPEMQTAIQKAKAQGLQVILFPQVSFPGTAGDYWKSAKRDEGWWITWFETYHRYIMQVTEWADLNEVDGIIIGDPSVMPSFSKGKLADGTSSKPPADADDQWRQLASDIRSRYSGMILGALSYPNTQKLIPGWLDSVDQLYVLYSPALSQNSAASVQELIPSLAQDLENGLFPDINPLGKNVVLGVNYPSASNAFAGCSDTLGSCLDNWGVSPVDLDVQARIYNAAIIAAGKEPWINGFVSRNYEPIVSLQDSSTSINGKPAFDVLWFWYHYILNISP
jgi:hypothetical protein